jgi:hypothetical protein
VVIGDLVRSDVAPVAEVGSVEVPATVVGSPRGRLPAALVGARELAGSS